MQLLLIKENNSIGLLDQANNSIIRKYNSRNKVLDFKKVGDKVIVQEEANFNEITSNIYCLDLEFNLLWYSELPFPKDSYPNSISWDSKINKNAISWESAYEHDSNCFTTSSRKGITVTINYNSGKIIQRVFTK